MDDLIEVRDLSFAYEGARDVFADISFTLGKGRLCALMGGNGSGKTTLIKCISGILKPSAGEVRVGGQSLEHISRRERARRMSVVPQEHATVFSYSVQHMVLMGRAPYIGTLALPGPVDLERAQAALEEVGIAHLSDKPFTNISGGERQLVLIARSLAQDTPVMLLDEPTSHLDYRNQILTLSVIRQLVRTRGLLALIATHDPNHALNFADEVLLLHQGAILCSGAPQEVITRETIRTVYGIDVLEFRRDGRVRGLMPAPEVINGGLVP